MLRLHHAPLACSLAARLALIEAGLDHEVVHVHTTRGEQKAAAYLAINPRGQVPALETPEGVLTESGAILPYIADLAPERELMPAAGAFARAQAQAWLSHLSSSVHTAYGALLNAELAPVHGVFREKLAKALGGVDAHLKGREFVLDRFSVCDLYLLVFATWRMVAGPLPALPNLDAFQQRMLARPGYAAILGEEMKLRAQAA
jgi:glutathione S-transferase